ncbi:hypothetical protein ACFE04_000221 [Oxalis oulophora]
MSWLFQINDPPSSTSPNPNSDENPPTSVITGTIGRQLRGVAAFLVPPPTTNKQVVEEVKTPSSVSSQKKLIGIRNDLAEIKEGFKRIASNLLYRNDDVLEEVDEEDYDYVAGINDEVIDFIQKISLRNEYWIDFPLHLDNFNIHDFEMSDDQKQHALAAERLVPSLATLRATTCSVMDDAKFWFIYFILLLPRLNQNDFDLLSTSKIVETRNTLLLKLQSKKNVQMNSEISSRPCTSQQGNDEIIHGEVETRESKEDIKSVIYATEGLRIGDKQNTTDTDTGSIINVETDENTSFSDLEDDDSDFSRRPSVNREKSEGMGSSPNVFKDWVQLNENSGLHKARHSVSRESEGESSDWLAVDDYD